MAKRPNLTDITAGFASATTYNDNNQETLDAFDNTLSRDGSTPNQMTADLDMNGNDLLNLNLPTSDPEVAGRLWNDGGTVKVSSG